MAERDLRERDILVAPQEFAYVQDLTKGDIVLYVGPTKISLSNTERLVVLTADRFVGLRTDDATTGVHPFVSASSSQYIILDNPPKDALQKPVKGANYAIELLTGRKVVVPGPASFPLWPGQKARVIGGHELREEQYLVTRVYDKVEGDDSPIGTEKIIKGTSCAFYIPQTGLEVVPDPDSGAFVRSAVTLQDGEYAILLAPNGQKKYVRGPSVVFPEPMETFLSTNNRRVFRAWHLKRNTGLHVRAIKDFEAAEGEQIPPGRYTSGQELFLKDREGFFYPTETLEVLGEVQAIPIAEKEGLYVRAIETGRIRTEVGPQNYLPDPTREDIVSRELSPQLAALYGQSSYGKLSRALSVYIPPSYAVLVTARDRREVVQGPNTRILHFDEDLEVLKLSTGRPKSEDSLKPTCFLLTAGNKVSDIVKVKTADHVELEVTLSYRVSFTEKEGAGKERWFNVNNYVALLCDHLASIVRAAVRSNPIDVFHAGSTEIIRTGILGERKEGKRSGRAFDENNMWVYDVEILDVKILDADVKKLLTDAQRSAITFEVTKKQEQQRLENERLKQEVNRLIFDSRISTAEKAVLLEEAEKGLAMARSRLDLELDRLERLGKARNQADALEVASVAESAARGRTLEVERLQLQSQVDAFKEQMSALAPELVTTLKVLGDQQLTAELTKNLSPLAILGGNTVAEVAERLMKSLPIGVKLQDGTAQAVSPISKADEARKSSRS